MSIFASLTLRNKLMLMAIVPLAALLAASMVSTFDKYRQAGDMARVRDLMAVSVKIGALAHELQKERGMSAGFIGSQGQKFASEIPLQRDAVDKQQKELASVLEGFDTGAYDPALQKSLDEAKAQLSGLAEKRQAISRLAIPAPEAIGYFTRTIGNLLAVAGKASTLSQQVDVTKMASAYYAFLQAKERAGIERAILANIFGADKFSSELLVRYLSTNAAQDTYFAVFNDYASEAQKRFFEETVRGADVDEVARLKRLAREGMNAASLGQDPAYWFKVATARIELLKTVENHLADEIAQLSDSLNKQALTMMWLYIGLSLASAVITIWLATTMIRLITRQIGGEPAEAVALAHNIASGKLDNSVALTAGDSSSLFATMKRMQEQLVERIDAERKVANEAQRIKIALDNVSTGVMIADNHRNIIYVNRAVVETLSRAEADIRKQLPNFSASNLVGTNIDGFHKVPAHQQQLLATFTSTYTAKMVVGGRSMVVRANPVITAQGERLGSVAEWTDRTTEVAVEHEVAELVNAAAAGDFGRRLSVADKDGFFRQLSEGINRLVETSERGMNDVARVLVALSEGDLTKRIDGDYQGLFGELKDSVNSTSERLMEIVGQIREATDAINTAAREIASGNADLSSRTESQASSLEETASSMDELTSTVKQNAENANQANQLARGASAVAVKGGDVVGEVVETMGAITNSSKKIADIISVIDGIAFQTNILALNAAVEAARAGEQGRGFAVVAGEVRNLAQRSAAAAKEIKQLIGDSVDKVNNGYKLVEQAGLTMQEIVDSVKRVTDIMSEITAASTEQSDGIEQVNQAVAQMDEVTQQNAALVEQAAAAAEALQDQAGALLEAVSVFKVARGGGKLAAPTSRAVAPVPAHKAAPVQKRTAARPPARDDEEWEEF